MAGIVSFDAKRLQALLDSHGLTGAWMSLLAGKLVSDGRFSYILDKPQFRGVDPDGENLLAGLTIGEISVLYEYSVASQDSTARKSNGQFFTPDDVAEFMASLSKRFGEGVWLDPCSGVGNLTWHLAAAQDNPEEFLLSKMVVSDRDELALFIARVLLTFYFQDREGDLFDKLEPKFLKFDFLSVSDGAGLGLFSLGDSLASIPDHDFVIMNPPYLASSKDVRFETAEGRDLYAYFLENTCKTSRGFIAITPQSFTNARKFRSLRSLLLRTYPQLTIYAFDNVPANIFRGVKFGSRNSNTANSIRAAITVASQGKTLRRITGLTRWRSNERRVLFQNIDRFASEVQLTEDFFPKVQAGHQDLYLSVKNLPSLSSIIARSKTEWTLFVPSSPRYFIPALKVAAKRSSQRELFFNSSSDRDLAYLLINSSLMYWWWRVRDGGMTLSQETLSSLPIPKFDIDYELIRELEVSETNNKVYKQNGGAKQENVKHPLELIDRVNNLVCPVHASTLINTHRNSEVSGLGEGVFST